MKETNAKVVYRSNGVQIARDQFCWTVSSVCKRGENARNPGEDALKDTSYHGTLRSACLEACYRIADQEECLKLKTYAQRLESAVAELPEVANKHASESLGGVGETPEVVRSHPAIPKRPRGRGRRKETRK
ncbi:MAG: hypothetical protein ABIG68_02670 [Acidobacteriota bacterium]